MLIAQLALALNGRDRGEVLSQMLELLADRELAGIGGGACTVSRLTDVITSRASSATARSTPCAGSYPRRAA